MEPLSTPNPTPVPDQPTPQLPSAAPPAQDDSEAKGLLVFVGYFVLALFVSMLLTTFAFASYIVDGPSMQTTLMNKDRLIVYKVPRTIARITRHPYIPHRGDIIIFNLPDGVDAGGRKQLIKRVIALPGERVTVKNGQVTVYNQEHPDGFSPDRTMAYGAVIGTTSGDVELTVPTNEVFVCGDNRPNSEDSRYFGTVPASNIVGKLGLRIFPVNKAQSF